MLTHSLFGLTLDQKPVTAYQLRNANGATATLLNYGATLQSLCVPNALGGFTDVVLGYDTLAAYERSDGYLGATVGRMANRIGGASFSLNGRTYSLAANDGPNHLHGGLKGFDKQIWDAAPFPGGITFSRLSPDGEEGYPGNLMVRVTYTLSADNALAITYEAETDQDTPVNLTNHSYFNLNGGDCAMNHILQLKAERFTENDEASLPTGRFLQVEGTPFDFRRPKPIGRDIEADHPQLKNGHGYDHNFVLSSQHAATLCSEVSGIRMDLSTDLPGLQLYTANFLTPRPGKNGTLIDRRTAICLETQLFPNAFSCYSFPSPVLRAGRKLCTRTVFQFSLY